MKFKSLAIRFAITAIAVVSFSSTSDAFASGLGGGSWGGGSLGSGFASRGYAGGSWGSARNFRTPVRDFFAYRQPVRRVLRGVAGGFGSRGWGSRGGSIGSGSIGSGSTGYQYYSSGNYGSRGSYSYGGGSTGASYISSGGVSSGAFSYAPATTYPATSYPSATYPTTYPSQIGIIGGASSCPDCIGSSALTPGSIPTGGNSIMLDSGAGISDGSGIIIGDQSVVPAEQYYDSGASSSTLDSSEGSGVRGFDTPPTPEPENGDETTSIINRRGDAVLQVSIPESAQVYVNNRLTATQGELRRYVSKNLKGGKEYSFNVQAVITRNGKEISLTKDVTLRAGRKSIVNFDFDQPVMTQVTVKVPENAKIKLCGNDTSATGEIRNFRTRLLPGKTWKNYKVAVEVEENGKLVTKQKTLTINAGEKYVVDFSDNANYLVKK